MKIIISPAKKLNIDDGIVDKRMQFKFMQESTFLVDIIKQKSVNEIKQLMDISHNLAVLNWERYQQWKLDNYKTYKAIFMFSGDVYQRMKAEKFNDSEMEFAQDNLRILSGLYGLLKPLDVVLPYRLEMGIKFNNSIADNLYDFWGDKLIKALLLDMKQNETLINLASNEYSKALRLASSSLEVITPIFKNYKNGELKVISFFAKKARGEMVNFIIKNKIKDPSELKLFSNDGYAFSEQSNSNMLFVR